MVSTQVNISGYQITEELYKSSRTLVYRGVREMDSLPVVIKLLKNPYPSFSELVQFRNQYTITKNINSPLIIETYSLEPYKNGYALVMEDFGGISLKDYLTCAETLHTKSLEEFLLIALALCNALEILYRNQIIHKDIKPANILIKPETKQVKLIDFSIASLLLRETQASISPNVLEGTLAYISPEQTGRMNLGIDYRTDFYSLGVTLYELLTGKLPFQSQDVMELVHCHIAKAPPLVHEIKSAIPSVISEIVSKLMAKNASDRYQSALGLKYDLEKCWIQLKETGKIESFLIAQRDVCDRFLIPERLYGRETEIETLLQAFERVSTETTEMMLVTGFSGTGKTAVVNEVYKPIVRQHGYFIKGKYDQFQRNIPFSGFVQAFRHLMGQLLAESDAQIQSWRSKILDAVGDNGQVIVEVIPELERIIGKQQPAMELSGTATQNRFNFLLQKVVQVFTTKEHPLVIFLDDLQWADSASLNLMQLLMNQSSGGYLLLIGAYRDNEVSAADPLILSLEKIKKAQAIINTITIAPLSNSSLNQLVADTLSCRLEVAQPLTQLVYEKTKGNPFFSTQFLKALYEDGLIKFDLDRGHWQCDITEVRALSLSNDVVEFMALQLQRLPQVTQSVLKLAACIGNQFDLKTLAIVSQHSEIETAACLWKALQEGLILPTSEIYKFYIGHEPNILQQDSQIVNYKFLHDRVQQAAYSLILSDQKQATHLKIGQLLLTNTLEQDLENRIFDIVNHLNFSADLITESLERTELAQYNLVAGRKAKAATAYSATLEYLTKGISLLPTESWQSHYDLTRSLHELITETAFLTGDFAQMDQWAAITLAHTHTLLDQIKIYEVQIYAQIAQKQPLVGIEIGLGTLKALGVDLPTHPTPSNIQQSLAETTALLPITGIAFLIDLPKMSDPLALAAMRISYAFAPAAYMAGSNLFLYNALAEIRTSIRQGNAPMSAAAYAHYGTVLCGVVNDIESGYQFGKLALTLAEQVGNKLILAKIALISGALIFPWKIHPSQTLELLRSGYQNGLESGSLEVCAFCRYYDAQSSYAIGLELAELDEKIAIYSQQICQIKQEAHLNWITLLHQVVLNLRGFVADPCRLVGEAAHEDQLHTYYQTTNNALGLYGLHLHKLMLCYWFGQDDAALKNAQLAQTYLGGVTAQVVVPLLYFYDSLLLLRLYHTLPESDQSACLEKVAAHQTKMQSWAQHAPTNFQHKYDLVVAEQHRNLGQKIEAIETYDRAISGAKENGYIQEEALANELAAKFYLDWGKEKFAAGYMQEAYYSYAKWGAKAKTSDLEKRYPQLLKPILEQRRLTLNPLETIATIARTSNTSSTYTNSTSISDVLDFISVLKAAQTISSNIELDELVTSLTKIILENSGAKKSILILPQEDTWQVRAMTFINHQANSPEQIQTILDAQSLKTCQDIPIKIINYVKNSQETVVIDNCQTDIPGVIGEYILKYQPKSILCTPILNQGHLVGILYLENQMTSGVFTNERLQVINLLSLQAAISLENARLYQQSQQALQDLQQAQLQIIQSEKMSALGNLVAGVAHEMNNPLGFISATLKQAKPNFYDIAEHLTLYQESLENPNDKIKDHAKKIDLDYTLEDLPKMIDAMVIACDRLENISTSLRTFSRADKDYKVPVNIHQGIDSTILILKHRLKANNQRPAIEMITDYGNLPQIECFLGLLNQVFMNIIANAIDALEEANSGRTFEDIKAHPNKIIVKTTVEDKQAKISIADNGKGMSEEIKQKIFDHLFTTKAIGQGTGLGLAIAQSIVVEKHNGSLVVNSTLGEGTQFVITLPILTQTQNSV